MAEIQPLIESRFELSQTRNGGRNIAAAVIKAAPVFLSLRRRRGPGDAAARFRL
jgi:hypothetical protein